MSLAIFFKSYMEAADLSLLVTIEETVNIKALPHRALKFVLYELSTASGDLNKYIHFLRTISNLQNYLPKAIRPRPLAIHPPNPFEIHAANNHFTKSFFVYKAVLRQLFAQQKF